MLRQVFLILSKTKVKSSNLSVDWKGDLYHVDVITDFSLSFIYILRNRFNVKCSKLLMANNFCSKCKLFIFRHYPGDHHDLMYNNSLINQDDPIK